MIAVSCGTPTPATTRVVQIEPGPIPTLTASAPAPISALVASAVATLPATIWTAFECLADPLDRGGTSLIVAVRGVDHDQVAFGVDQGLDAREALVADRGRGGDAQPPGGVLGRVGIGDRFLDILDRDQADAAAILVDDEQLLDPVLVKLTARFLLGDAWADGDRDSRGSSARTPADADFRRSGRRDW